MDTQIEPKPKRRRAYKIAAGYLLRLANVNDLRAAMERYADENRLKLTAIYEDKPTEAEVNLDERPAGQKLLEAIAAKGDGKKVRHVILPDLTVIAPADLAKQLRNLKKRNRVLHILRWRVMRDSDGRPREGIDGKRKYHTFTTANDPAGIFYSTVERLKAALERPAHAAMEVNGKRSVGRVNSATPYGFDRVGYNLYPNESEQATLAQMRTMRKAGASLRDIARALNADQVPAKRGGKWTANTVRHCLSVWHRSARATHS